MLLKKVNMNIKKQNNLYIFGKHSVIAALNNPRRKSKALYTTKIIGEEFKALYPKLNIIAKDPKDLSIMLPNGNNHQNMILEVEALKSYTS